MDWEIIGSRDQTGTNQDPPIFVLSKDYPRIVYEHDCFHKSALKCGHLLSWKHIKLPSLVPNRQSSFVLCAETQRTVGRKGNTFHHRCVLINTSRPATTHDFSNLGTCYLMIPY